MKIIRQGKKYDTNWLYLATCERCNGVYEFDKKDLEAVNLYSDGISYGFRCPNSDCMNFIPAPVWVRVNQD